MRSTSNRSPRQTLALSGGVGIITAVMISLVLGGIGSVIPAGQVTAADSSAVTLTSAQQDEFVDSAPFPELAVTVSQTRDLVSQGLAISWTGGKRSTVPSGDTGGENFLQIMQCWGDDPSVPEGKPAQPDRTTCQYGAFLTAGATRDNFVTQESVAPEDEKYTAPRTGPVSPAYTSIPFLSAGGKLIASVVDNVKVPVDVNTNEFFTQHTSNEVKWAGSGESGAGSTTFELQTAQQSPGLGCGAPLKTESGEVLGASCWLVVIPRGTADAGSQHVVHSGLFWDSWKHKLAVKLDFKPLGVNCALGAAERQISGSELAAAAVASWQPKLCNAEGGSIYTLSTGTESDALAAASGTSPDALALTSRPRDPAAGADPNAYAPIAVTGLAIGFEIDRQPKADSSTPEDALARANEPFRELKLTPRLVAKLLTNSYLDSLPVDADKSHLGYVSAAKPGKNARNLTFDPEFLEINDKEWAYQALTSPSLADLLSPQGRSDGAWQLWRYVLADADAVAFLAGDSDPWGMVVNPWNSTDKAANPSGYGLALPRDNFPKADPVEQKGTALAGPVNLVTWRPYTNDFDQSAYLTLRGDGQVLGPWNTQTTPQKYDKSTRNLTGFQKVLGLTDTASAAKYQLVLASLRTPAGTYVAPTTESLSAGAAAMVPTSSQRLVLEYDPASANAKAAPTAYPLTMPVYAATNPQQTDAGLRASYAAFIRYAVSAGQEPGTASGMLPAGYAPLPQSWRDQALAQAQLIQDGKSAITSQYTPTGGSNYSNNNNNAPAATTPAAHGSTPDLFGPATPDDPNAGAMAATVPLSLLGGVGAAAAVPLMSRIRRR